MSDAPSAAPLVFGLVILDLQRRELTRRGRGRPLRPAAFDVLAYLASHPHRIVTPAELGAAVWDNPEIDVATIERCLADVRRALHPEADPIRRLDGQGYRFDADVRAAESGTDPYGEFVEDPESTLDEGATGRRPESPRPRARPATRARLPWIAAAAVIVAGVGWMVLTRSTRPDTAAVAEASTVAPQVTLNTQVVKSMVAGNDAAARLTAADLQRARVAYDQAVKADPRYAPAYGALANTLATLYTIGAEAPKDLLPLADAYARRAIELDPNHTAGWTALAQAHTQWTRNWTGAEAGFRRALTLAPTNAMAAARLGELFAVLNRPAEAVAQSATAVQLEPNSPLVQTSAGIVHALTGRPGEARAFFERAVTLAPQYAAASVWQARMLAESGQFEAALTASRRARADRSDVPSWVEGYVQALDGRTREATAVLRALEGQARAHYVPATDIALLHVFLGSKEDALTWLERGMDERSPGMDRVAVDPAFASLRDHARFKSVVAALKLPETR